jgi:hypothetical protein
MRRFNLPPLAVASFLPVACLLAALCSCGSEDAGPAFFDVPLNPSFSAVERPFDGYDPLTRDEIARAELRRQVDSAGAAKPLVPDAWQRCLELTRDVVSDNQKLFAQSEPWQRLVFGEAPLRTTAFYTTTLPVDSVRSFYESALSRAGWHVIETFVRAASFSDLWAAGIERDGGSVRAFVAYERPPGEDVACVLIAVQQPDRD